MSRERGKKRETKRSISISNLDVVKLTKKKEKKPSLPQKPTGAVRVLSFAGTLALGGVLVYFWTQNEKQQKIFEEERKRQW